MEFGKCQFCKLHRELYPHYYKELGQIIEICDNCFKTKLSVADKM